MTGLHDNRSILWLKTDSSPDKQLEEQEDEQWLQNRLAELPSTQHAILVMRQVEQRSSQEIARLLCITEASVRTLLARARHTLFEELKKRK
jgi:RNA polymerase sigma-70 factor (ECF subfamily)